MDKIVYLCPSDREAYLHILQEVAPRLDDAGVSFHVCHPGEDVAAQIMKSSGKEVTT